ncbi:MAG: hypothetical protein WAO09_05180 [Candidatus Dormiibacterota bacterium]|jgi:hypothetical protein
MGSFDPSLAEDEDKLGRWLREAPVVDLERIAWGSNAVFQAHLAGPEGDLLAVYKPARGERPLWDFPGATLHRREVATSVVDRALGWRFTPTTVLRSEAPLGVGSVQEFIPDPPLGLELDPAHVQSRLRGLAVLDVLINNADRKREHLLIDPEGELRGIDHGVTFHADFKLRTTLIELSGTPVPAEWLAAVRSLFEDTGRLSRLRRRLARLLGPEEIGAFENRGRQLLKQGSYPELHQWYGRPFEW